MKFTKMQGIGNDYIYLDCVRGPVPRDPSALARRVSDRHFGIGGDGLVLILPGDEADFGCGCITRTAARRKCAATRADAWGNMSMTGA